MKVVQLVELKKHKPPSRTKSPYEDQAACLALVWKQQPILTGFSRGQWVSRSSLPKTVLTLREARCRTRTAGS